MSKIKILSRSWKLSIVLFFISMLPVIVNADSCSYREALMAFDNGNTVRATALMQMASRDGDARATQYLADFTRKQAAVVLVTTATTSNGS